MTGILVQQFVLLGVVGALAACVDQANGGGAGSRDQITAVGSSTVYPFTTMIAEQLVANDPDAKAPVIESTGTGAGMKLFCAGVGAAHPDIEDASRRMKASEYATCAKNGVRDVIEIQVGIDGIAFAEAKNGPKMQLTPTDLYKALAANPGGKVNTARVWHDVNPALPAVPIQVYGPPATSGTRDALAELILTKGCEASDPSAKALAKSDAEAHKALCTRVREDGVYVDAGENDNLIVQKLQSNPNAIGVFGYSYLEENKDNVNGVSISGVAPTYATIADNAYPGSRPLYIYVKKAHLTAIPGLRNLLKLYAANWGATGPLVKRGLIASPAAIQARSAAIIANETVLDPAVLS
ncbi:phosphate ABC transporter substrate-binding protein (PhoT family) [Sphingomonas faeni]|uniref:Phosphate ABC transporter substrate-binding protein (PhoT family) n=1 Tax=Sphingomonas faeni TaxID=185950 RepID=A0A2T5U7A0_9SPHN|nr:substrate-binding domain-containing protein [Sphingomonas faeni]PTW47389.1 phosphate ABC transporter substrate-binding protein (PhoT family) [Sphingomonas faeni]